LNHNQLTGAVDLSRLPASLESLYLQYNAGMTGAWRGKKPDDYDFDGTGITVTGA
jgi:hypothetical protein